MSTVAEREENTTVYLNSDKRSVVTIVGLPGTGKTTTLATMLGKVHTKTCPSTGNYLFVILPFFNYLFLCLCRFFFCHYFSNQQLGETGGGGNDLKWLKCLFTQRFFHFLYAILGFKI